MKVQRKQQDLADLDATAVFVTFDDPDVLRRTLLAGLDPVFPVLVDPDRDRYRAWGLVRLPWWQVWLDPAVWKVYGRLLAAGERWRGLGTDTRQMGGDFIVDAGPDAPPGTADTVTYSRPQRRDDRPPAGELYRHIRGLGGQR